MASVLGAWVAPLLGSCVRWGCSYAPAGILRHGTGALYVCLLSGPAYFTTTAAPGSLYQPDNEVFILFLIGFDYRRRFAMVLSPFSLPSITGAFSLGSHRPLSYPTPISILLDLPQ